VSSAPTFLLNWVFSTFRTVVLLKKTEQLNNLKIAHLV